MNTKLVFVLLAILYALCLSVVGEPSTLTDQLHQQHHSSKKGY